MHKTEVIRFQRIEDVPPDVWRDLTVTDSLFTSRQWTLTLRQSNRDVPVEFWVGRTDGRSMGIPVHVYPKAPGRSTYNVWALHEHDFTPQCGVDHLQRPHVLIGTRNGQRNGFIRDTATTFASDMAVAILEAIEQTHASAVLSMLYLSHGLLSSMADRLPQWSARFIDAAGELAVPEQGSNIETFLATMDDRRGKRRIRAELRGIEDDPVMRIDDLDEIEGLAPHLAPLLVNLQQRHGQPASETSMAAYIAATARSGLTPQLFLSGSREAPRGFSLSVHDDRLMSVRVSGFDYAKLDDNHGLDYPRLSFYEPLRYATRVGLKAVDLGVGALYAKMLRGAQAIPLYSLSRFPDELGVRANKDGDVSRVNKVRAACPKIPESALTEWSIS